MGNFCAQFYRETEILNSQSLSHNGKNSKVCQFNIKQNWKLQLIVGSYRYHKADLLLNFSQLQYVQYSPEIKEYAQNYLEFIETASLYSKKIVNVHVNRSCLYKRFVVVLLSPYNSFQSESYLSQFQAIMIQILNSCSQFALQIYETSQNGKGIPNQTLIAQFINFIMDYQRPIRIYLISDEIRLLNIVRYQMAKKGHYKRLLDINKNY